MFYTSTAGAGLSGLTLLVVVLAGCQTYGTPNTPTVTETDGSHVRLPNGSTKAVVWGTHPEAVKSLKTWLLKQRVTLVDDVKMNQLASDLGLHVPISNADVFKLAKSAGTNQVIFVDADVSAWQRSELVTLFGQAPIIYNASLFIRALDAETGEIDWNGKALSTQTFSNLTDGIHQLTCQALATAWGLREPGTTTGSSICPPGQNVMMVTEPSPAPAGTAKASDNGENVRN